MRRGEGRRGGKEGKGEERGEKKGREMWRKRRGENQEEEGNRKEREGEGKRAHWRTLCFMGNFIHGGQNGLQGRDQLQDHRTGNPTAN